MLDALRTPAAIVFVFGIVIFVHELGHFLAAKAVGVYAPRFSIGFGPALLSFKWGETEYVLALLPLGGYVRMASREDETMAFLEGGGERPVPDGVETVGGSGAPPLADGGTPARKLPRHYDPNGMAPFGPRPVPEHRWFESKPLPARLLIMFAGVTMNLVLGFVLFAGMNMILGRPVIRTQVVGDVRPFEGTSELRSRLVSGDTILAVDGHPVSSWNDIQDSIASDSGSPVVLRTQRGTVEVPVVDSGGLTRPQLAFAVLQPMVSPVIDRVLPGQPAARAGLRPGDSVVAVGEERVSSWGQFVGMIERSPGREVPIVVQRGGATRRITVRPDSTRQPLDLSGRDTVLGKIGAAVRQFAEHETIPPGRALALAWDETWSATGLIVRQLRWLATGRASLKNLNGPVAIAQASGTAAKLGWEALLDLVALISINLAVFNLLPIPILDGGQILMNVAEAVKGGPLSTRTRENLLRFGLAAIALLFVLVMFNDLTPLARRLFGP